MGPPDKKSSVAMTHSAEGVALNAWTELLSSVDSESKLRVQTARSSHPTAKKEVGKWPSGTWLYPGPYSSNLSPETQNTRFAQPTSSVTSHKTRVPCLYASRGEDPFVVSAARGEIKLAI